MACTTVNLIQGPQGPAGANGTNGVDGDDAWTTTTGAFTMPAEGANATVNVLSSDMFTSGDTLYVQGAGYMDVQSIPSSTQVVLRNLEATATRQYTANVAPGTVVASGNKIVPGGVQGPTGNLNYALYQHQLANGTDAGDFDTGAWRTAPLNTEVADTGGDGALAANAVTLAAATYRARWRVCGFQVGRFQSRLFNQTAGAVIDYGSNVMSGSADTTANYSHGESRFTLATAQAVRLEARCQTTNAGDGFGQACSFGNIEVYASVLFERET